jgi:hypothetical protein
VVNSELVDSPLEDAAARPITPATAAQERSFPLIALLQLATFLAALVSCIDSRGLSRRLRFLQDEPWIAAAAVVGACCAVGLVGLIVGASQLRMKRSALAGAAVGGLYGLIILAVFVAPASLPHAAAAAAMAVLTTIAIRIRAD